MTSDKGTTDGNGRLFMRRALVKGRREVLRLGGVGLLGAMATAQAEGAEAPGVKFKVLGENDRVDIGDRGKQIIEEAYKRGFELGKKHGGCARCTVVALQKP